MQIFHFSPFLAVILARSFGANAVAIPAHTSETLSQRSAESLDLTPDWSINWDLTNSKPAVSLVSYTQTLQQN
jgi:hypothetical protein